MGLMQQLVAEVLAEAVPDDLPCLSGALLDVEGRGLLLVGAPGSGVSTMVVAMLRAGAALVSEQVVVLGRGRDACVAAADHAHEGVDGAPGHRGSR